MAPHAARQTVQTSLYVQVHQFPLVLQMHLHPTSFHFVLTQCLCGRSRVISIDEETVKILRAHRRKQVEDKLSLGDGWKGESNGHVFTTAWAARSIRARRHLSSRR